jgi:hypothetical protein
MEMQQHYQYLSVINLRTPVKKWHYFCFLTVNGSIYRTSSVSESVYEHACMHACVWGGGGAGKWENYPNVANMTEEKCV